MAEVDNILVEYILLRRTSGCCCCCCCCSGGGFVYIPSCPMLGVLFWYIVGARPNALLMTTPIKYIR